MTKLVNPIPLFLDGRGILLDAGFIYVGQAGTDPEVPGNQIALYFDKALTIPASQPLRTLGGTVVNGMNNGKVYFAEADFSMVVRDADGNLVFNEPSAFDTAGADYQQQNDSLDAIAAQSNTVFGLSLLEAADAAALIDLAGLGSAALLDEATAAQYRANTADKVLTTDQAWGAAQSVPLAIAGSAVAVDLNTGINFTLAMTATGVTLSTPTNGKDGQSGKIEITQDATGSRTLTYDAGWLFAGGVDPVLSTAPNSRDVLYYCVLSDGKIHGSLNKALS